jgi:hypothetical protein
MLPLKQHVQTQHWPGEQSPRVMQGMSPLQGASRSCAHTLRLLSSKSRKQPQVWPHWWRDSQH